MFGIVEGEEAALVKPVARALMLRDALRANAHGWARVRTGRAADPEGRGRSCAGAAPAAREEAPLRATARSPIRWAIRCSRRCAPGAARWRWRRRSRPM
ncbi:MAG: hypothetical protein WDN24_21505 [Sphingomonas sp.]